MFSGGNVSTYRPRVNKVNTPVIPSVENNKKKFAFLSCETVPDYRPKDVLNEKTQKTSVNQSTKFHQLQQMFDNINSSTEVSTDIPLYKQLNTIGDNINTENEVSCTYLKNGKLFCNIHFGCIINALFATQFKVHVKALRPFTL